MSLAETVLSEWKQRDPFLSDLEGFERYFTKRHPVLQKKAKKEFERQMKLLVRVFMAPIIVWKGAWMDTIPKWLLDYIKIDRLVALMKKEYDGGATDAEALAYIMPRTMEMPLSHEWTRIYLYLGTKVMREAKQFKMPKDVAVKTLSDYEERLLNGLKDWIWEKQEQALRQRRRQEAKRNIRSLRV